MKDSFRMYGSFLTHTIYHTYYQRQDNSAICLPNNCPPPAKSGWPTDDGVLPHGTDQKGTPSSGVALASNDAAGWTVMLAMAVCAAVVAAGVVE